MPEGVHAVGAVGIGLTGVDGRPGRGVDDDLGLNRPDGGEHRVTVGHVEGAATGGDDIERRATAPLAGPALKLGDDLGSDLAGRAGHQHTHSGPGFRFDRTAPRWSPTRPRRPVTAR